MTAAPGRRLVAAALLGSIALAAALEAGARLLVPEERVYRLERTAGGEERLVARVWAQGPWAATLAFPARKTSGRARVVFLGESTTAGFPYPAEVAFPARVEAAAPSRIEALNFGLIAIPLEETVRRFEEALDYDPDAVVVYAGHNDLKLQTLLPLRERLRTGAIARARETVARLAIARALSRLLGPERPRFFVPPPVPADPEEGLALRRPTQEERALLLAGFEEGFRRTARLAREGGVPLLVILPASNLRDFAPVDSRAGLSPGTPERRRFEGLLGEGRRVRGEGKTREALALLEEAVALDPGHAGARFERGRALLALGERARGREDLVAARDLDAAPVRLPSDFVAATRRICEGEGVPWIDASSALARASFDGVEGAPVFLDEVHPSMEGHRLLARAALEGLARAGVGGFETGAALPDPPPAGLPAEADQLVRYRSAQYLYPRAFRLDDPALTAHVAGLLEGLERERPDFPLVALLRAILRAREGDPEGVEALRRAARATSGADRENVILRLVGLGPAEIEAIAEGGPIPPHLAPVRGSGPAGGSSGR